MFLMCVQEKKTKAKAPASVSTEEATTEAEPVDDKPAEQESAQQQEEEEDGNGIPDFYFIFSTKSETNYVQNLRKLSLIPLNSA